jgi:hydrogenase maturation protease
VVRILAVGSPHGDDRACWEVVEWLGQRPVPGVEAAVLAGPLDLLGLLEGCTRLVVVDACRSGAAPGTVVRIDWPDARLYGSAGPSSHGVGVAEALALAEALGKLPPRVTLIGVEVGICGPGAEMGPEVQAALPELYRQILEEICPAERRKLPDPGAGGGKP